MERPPLTRALTLVLAATVALIAAGCNSTESQMTKQEEADFKGKPIPPEVLEKMKSQAGKPGASGQ